MTTVTQSIFSRSVPALGNAAFSLPIGSVPADVVILRITVTLHLDTAMLVKLEDPDGNDIEITSSGPLPGVIFDDSAPTSIDDASPPFSGSYRPVESFSSLFPGTINGSCP